MKIKKLVSALSALTIAAGTFAGLAVTASAADTSKDPIFSVDYTADGVSTDGWTTSVDDATNHNNYVFEVSEGVGLEIKPAIYGGRNRKLTATYMFSDAEQNPITYDGNVTFQFSFWSQNDTTTEYQDRKPIVTVLDDKGESLLAINEEGQAGNLYVDGELAASTNRLRFRSSKFDVTVNIDFNAGKLDYTIVTQGQYNGTEMSGAETTTTGSKDISSDALGGIKVETGTNIQIADNTYGAIRFYGMKVWKDIDTTVNPTATYEQIGDYTSETETDNKASAFKLNVTAGTNAIKSVGAKVNDKMSENTINTTINSGSTVVFAIAVNAAAEDVESIKAVIDGTTDIDATPVTVTTIE